MNCNLMFNEDLEKFKKFEMEFCSIKCLKQGVANKKWFNMVFIYVDESLFGLLGCLLFLSASNLSASFWLSHSVLAASKSLSKTTSLHGGEILPVRHWDLWAMSCQEVLQHYFCWFEVLSLLFRPWDPPVVWSKMKYLMITVLSGVRSS